MSITIYDARPEDIPAIQALVQAVYAARHGAEAAAALRQRRYDDETLRRAIANSATRILLAYDDEAQLAGYCRYGAPLLDDCEDALAIHELVVHPDRAIAAVAAGFIDIMEDELDETACTQRLIAYAPPDDKARLVFFFSSGFMHIQVEDTADEWYFEKIL